MRQLLSVIFVVSIAGLIACAIISVKSKRRYSNPVAMLLFGLIVPVLGNLFIIASDIEGLSLVGCYVYFIGMNIAMFTVFNFGFEYCNFPRKYVFIKYIKKSPHRLYNRCRDFQKRNLFPFFIFCLLFLQPFVLYISLYCYYWYIRTEFAYLLQYWWTCNRRYA